MIEALKKLIWGTKAYQVLEAREFEERMRNTQPKVILDVRSKSEFDDMKIPHAVNIDILNPNFKNRVAQFDKSRPVFVYCQKGGRGAKACKILTGLGFETVINLKGGLAEYSGKVV
jgi:rhodanese-related sulfurtransferase